MKSIITLSIANGLWGISQWLVFAFLAHKASNELLTSFTLIQAYIAPIFLLFGLNLRSVVCIDKTFSFRAFSQLRLTYTALAILFSTTLLLFNSTLYSFPLIFGNLVLFKAFEHFSELFSGHLQSSNKFNILTNVKFLKSIFLTSSFWIIYEISGIISFSMIAFPLSHLIFLRYERKNINLNIESDSERTKNVAYLKAFRMFAPLGITAFIDSIAMNIPRYFLEFKDVAYLVPVYSAIAYSLFFSGIIFSSISAHLLPEFVKYIENSQIHKLRNKIYIISFLVIIIVSTFSILIYHWGDKLLLITYGERFMVYSYELALIIFSTGIWIISGVIGIALLSLKEYNSHLMTHIVMLIGGLISCMFSQTTVVGAISVLITIFTVRLLYAYIIFYKKTAHLSK